MEAFPIMHVVYLGIINYIEVGDAIFDRLINENYQVILRKSNELFSMVLEKIWDAFSKAFQDLAVSHNKQSAIICMNYIEKIFKSEK